MEIGVTAEPTNPGYRLTGEKWVISNATRSDMLTLFVRTLPQGGSRGFSLLLVDKRELEPATYEPIPPPENARRAGVGRERHPLQGGRARRDGVDRNGGRRAGADAQGLPGDPQPGQPALAGHRRYGPAQYAECCGRPEREWDDGGPAAVSPLYPVGWGVCRPPRLRVFGPGRPARPAHADRADNDHRGSRERTLFRPRSGRRCGRSRSCLAQATACARRTKPAFSKRCCATAPSSR